MSSEIDRLPSLGDIVLSAKNKAYKLVSLLGEGGYGCVFEARSDSSSRQLALKAERFSRTVLKVEVAVLKVANARKCVHICKLYDYGHVQREFMFIVMTLLGPDLNKLKNEQTERRFTIGTTVRAAMQTLNAIEELHECGYLSRDIKPGNFAIGNVGNGLHRRIYIFDFGLARRYVDKNFKVLPSRGRMGWRGTTRYGSLNAHHRQDLGRKDDLESWLYMIVELAKGHLPWRTVTDRDAVRICKEEARAVNKLLFFSECPVRFQEIMEIVDKLDFAANPPYQVINEILSDIMKENKILENQRYDWEKTDECYNQLPPTLNHSSSNQSPVNEASRSLVQRMPHT